MCTFSLTISKIVSLWWKIERLGWRKEIKMSKGSLLRAGFGRVGEFITNIA